MCGRFVLTADGTAIQLAFGLDSTPENIVPRFNIAPTQPVAVITNENPHELTYHLWGLIPAWSKDPKMGSSLINARSETVDEKPAFRSAFKRRRCLIPSNGFYEWQKRSGGKAPMFIHLKGRELFAFAGLWEVWRSPDGDEIRSCTIITTSANRFTAPIHERMPVILPSSDYATWLAADEQPPALLKGLLKPYDPELMAAYEVSKVVNKPGFDTPECIEPVA